MTPTGPVWPTLPREHRKAPVAIVFCFLRLLFAQVYIRATTCRHALGISPRLATSHSESSPVGTRIVLLILGLTAVAAMDPGSLLHQVAGTSGAAARLAARDTLPSSKPRDKMFDATHTPRREGKERKGRKRKKGSTTPTIAGLQLLTWNARGLRSEVHTSGLLAFLEDEWPKVDIILLTESNLRPTDMNTTLSNNDKWEVHRIDELPGEGKIKTGGVVLLVKKKKGFKVSFLRDFREFFLSAATWEISHPSWTRPMQIHGVYRNHAVPGKGPGGARQQQDTEDKQATALQMIAAAMDDASTFSVLLGDLNLWIGETQQHLTFPQVSEWPDRLSDHKLPAPLANPAKLFMDIVNDEGLLILNGRFGPSSAGITFEREYTPRGSNHRQKTQTLLDYAVCHQRWGRSIKHLEVHDNTGRLSDHKPLHLHIQCETVDPNLRSWDGDAGEMEWWEEESRPRIDTTPFSLPDDDPDRKRATDLYQQQLTAKLSEPNARLQYLLHRLRTCQTLNRRGEVCKPTCLCHNMQEPLDEAYAGVSDAILSAAQVALESKPPSSNKLRQRQTVWRPGPEWKKLKHEQTQAWKDLSQTVPQSDEHDAAHRKHKAACHRLRVHVADDRSRWQSKRFSKISLQGPAHTMRNAWSFLKRQVGAEEVQPGLPKKVKLDDGSLLSGHEATAQWHKTRAKIGCHDDAHPGFDPQAHEARKQRLRRIEIEEAEKIRTSLPSADKDDIMMREISPLEIAAMLAASSNGTAPGTDQLPYELLTNGGEAVRTTLLLVYNLGWFAGLHPSPWDLALVRPLFKAKTKEPLVIANYRAVSLINCICKGYETVLFNRTSAHLESRKDISPGQGARRHMGTEELLYTITSTAKARYAHSGKGTYVCFIDFTLAYPSTDHNVIFTKMRDKGITGRLWANIRHLYRNMQSRVMHPDISQDDFFKIVSGVREGSVLSPILFIIAVDDMLEYLKARPFRSKDHHSSNRSPDPSTSTQRQRRTDNRPPGVWIHSVYLALLQFVDDSCLLATSPEELQHMINVIAEYCSIYRLSLNPRPGKTEVVEFMCEPSGYQYSVATPSAEQPSLRTNLRISLGYRYLGAWIDKWLTLKRLVAEMLSSMSTETDKVVAMGGQPGGLPIRTTFHLWSSLVLSHVYPTIAFVSEHQVQKIQHALLSSVNKLAGALADPQAVLADLGLPDAVTIRDLRLGTLVNRLRTLPEYMVAASLHRTFMSSQTTRSRGTEAEYRKVLTKHNSLALWLPSPPPQDTLTKVWTEDGVLLDPIKQARRAFKTEWKKVVWKTRKAAMLAGTAPFESAKFALFASTAAADLQRNELWTCAPYVLLDVGPKHRLALFQFRTQSSLLAAHKKGAAEQEEEVDPRCDGCDTRLRFLQTKLKDARALQPARPEVIRRLASEITALRELLSNDPSEDCEHALFHCTKGDLPSLRVKWEAGMTAIFEAFKPRETHEKGIFLAWADLDTETQIKLALGTQPAITWFFTGHKAELRRQKRARFHQKVVETCAAFSLQICRTLRNYKKASDADVIENAGTWQRVHDDWDWGPLMEELETSDDEPTDDRDP